MKHRLFSIFAGMSLLMGMTSIAMWVRSYGVYTRFEYALTQNTGATLSANWYTMNLCCGGVQYSFQNRTASTPNQIGNLTSWAKPLGFAVYQWRDSSELRYPWLIGKNSLGVTANRLGFGISKAASNDPLCITGSDSISHFTMPFWFVTITFAIMPLLWVGKRIFTTVISDGFCKSCGYDLRATPERCPECGATVDPASG